MKTRSCDADYNQKFHKLCFPAFANHFSINLSGKKHKKPHHLKPNKGNPTSPIDDDDESPGKKLGKPGTFSKRKSF